MNANKNQDTHTLLRCHADMSRLLFGIATLFFVLYCAALTMGIGSKWHNTSTCKLTSGKKANVFALMLLLPTPTKGDRLHCVTILGKREAMNIIINETP